jgi:hypothetical protein
MTLVTAARSEHRKLAAILDEVKAAPFRPGGLQERDAAISNNSGDNVAYHRIEPSAFPAFFAVNIKKQAGPASSALSAGFALKIPDFLTAKNSKNSKSPQWRSPHG